MRDRFVVDYIGKMVTMLRPKALTNKAHLCIYIYRERDRQIYCRLYREMAKCRVIFSGTVSEVGTSKCTGGWRPLEELRLK